MREGTEITPEERDALYEQLLIHLSSIDDLRAAIQAEDFDTAERLALQFGDEFRLMQDLGWACAPAGITIKLTSPPEQLHRVFSQLRLDVERQEADERLEITEISPGFRERARRITAVCERVLSRVARTLPASTMAGDS